MEQMYHSDISEQSCNVKNSKRLVQMLYKKKHRYICSQKSLFSPIFCHLQVLFTNCIFFKYLHQAFIIIFILVNRLTFSFHCKAFFPLHTEIFIKRQIKLERSEFYTTEWWNRKLQYCFLRSASSWSDISKSKFCSN